MSNPLHDLAPLDIVTMRALESEKLGTGWPDVLAGFHSTGGNHACIEHRGAGGRQPHLHRWYGEGGRPEV
jgi:hypothetical protein